MVGLSNSEDQEYIGEDQASKLRGEKMTNNVGLKGKRQDEKGSGTNIFENFRPNLASSNGTFLSYDESNSTSIFHEEAKMDNIQRGETDNTNIRDGINRTSLQDEITNNFPSVAKTKNPSMLDMERTNLKIDMKEGCKEYANETVKVTDSALLMTYKFEMTQTSEDLSTNLVSLEGQIQQELSRKLLNCDFKHDRLLSRHMMSESGIVGTVTERTENSSDFCQNSTPDCFVFNGKIRTYFTTGIYGYTESMAWGEVLGCVKDTMMSEDTILNLKGVSHLNYLGAVLHQGEKVETEFTGANLETVKIDNKMLTGMGVFIIALGSVAAFMIMCVAGKRRNDWQSTMDSAKDFESNYEGEDGTFSVEETNDVTSTSLSCSPTKRVSRSSQPREASSTLTSSSRILRPKPRVELIDEDEGFSIIY